MEKQIRSVKGGATGGRWPVRAHFVRLALLATAGFGLGAIAAPTAPSLPGPAVLPAGDAAALPAPWPGAMAAFPGMPPAARRQAAARRHLARFASATWPVLAEPPPDVQMASPATSRAPLDSVVRLDFTEPMDAFSVQSSFRIKPAVEGTTEWPDARTMVFRPAALAPSTTYQVSVVGLSSTRHRLAAIGSFSFTTLYPPPKVAFPFVLTFDDCASADAIMAIVGALADRGLKATFFPTGVCRDLFPWLVPSLIAAGHRVCNHTYSHPDLTKLSDAAVWAQIQGGVATGCDLFRPPYGAIDRGGRIAGIAASLGYRIQLWDVDTRDWAGTSAAAMVAMIRARGGVVLMHLHGAHTVEAIRTL